MKTGSEWLQKLPEQAQKNFLINLQAHHGLEKSTDFLTRNHSTLNSFIAWAFNWDTSYEGKDYWSLISIGVFPKNVYSIYSNNTVKEICVIPTRNKCFTNLFNNL